MEMKQKSQVMGSLHIRCLMMRTLTKPMMIKTVHLLCRLYHQAMESLLLEWQEMNKDAMKYFTVQLEMGILYTQTTQPKTESIYPAKWQAAIMTVLIPAGLRVP